MTGKMFAIAALGALASATPAAAQWNGSGVDTQSLRAQIDDGVARGALSPEDAATFRSQLRGLDNLQRQYAGDGLTGSEREDLRQRALGLRNEIANAEGQAPSSYGRYGAYGNGYDGGNRYNYGNGAYGSGAYGNRTYDNGAYGNGAYGNGAYGNGAYDNRAYGNGAYGDRGYGNGAYSGRYGNEQYDRDQAYPDTADRGDQGYGRDDAYDRDDTDDQGGYMPRVGDRAPGGLYAVPSGYRDRFRDGGGVYYRYGGGNVYQIDARNGTVLRIYPIDR